MLSLEENSPSFASQFKAYKKLGNVKIYGNAEGGSPEIKRFYKNSNSSLPGGGQHQDLLDDLGELSCYIKLK